MTVADLFLKRNSILLGWVVFLLLFGLWVLKPLNEPLIGDASMFPLLVHKVLEHVQTPEIDIQSGKDIWHPFLYQSIAIMVAAILGPDLVWQRLIGIGGLGISLLLLWKIAGNMKFGRADRRAIILLTSFIFILVPYGIVGVVHTDIDNAVLPPILLLFIYFFNRFILKESGNRKQYLWLCSVALAFGFWAKLTTPFLLPLAVAIFFLLKRKIIEAVYYPMFFILTGGGLFFITWVAFCLFFNLPFQSVFYRTISVFVSKSTQSGGLGWLAFARESMLILLWLNPLVVATWIVSVWHFLKTSNENDSASESLLFINILTFLILFGYLVVGRIIFSVPKYHFPAIILMSFTLACWLYPQIEKSVIRNPIAVFMTAFLLSVIYYSIGDPIYVLTYGLKWRAMNHLTFKPVLLDLSWMLGAYFLPLAVIALMIRTRYAKKVWIVLVVFAVAQTMGFHFRQMQAPYRIGYAYGYKDGYQVHERLPNDGQIVYPEGAIFPPWGRLKGSVIINNRSTSLNNWEALIRQTRPDAIVLGPAVSPLSSVREMYGNTELMNLISDRYRMATDGDYRLYLLRENVH